MDWIFWILVALGIAFAVSESELFAPVRRYLEPHGKVGEVVSCPICFGFWSGMFVETIRWLVTGTTIQDVQPYLTIPSCGFVTLTFATVILSVRR